MGLVISIGVYVKETYNHLTGSSDSYTFTSIDDDVSFKIESGKAPLTHIRCRSCDPSKLIAYQAKIDKLKPDEIVYRTYVPDHKVSWSVDWTEYKPVDYTNPKLLNPKPVWADPSDPFDITNWNVIDHGKIDRRSHVGLYQIVDGVPLNPVGRTGVVGRGQLGKWGVNHAADPVVTRWKRNPNGSIVKEIKTGKPLLQFVSIQRLDTDEWAIPGGMCDPGEKISKTLKREFMEEATDSISNDDTKRKQIDQHLAAFFEKGVEIYRGYVDDPRNTDNAWMETTAYNFHDEDNETFKNFNLNAGDDAGSVTWMDLDQNIKLYASHKHFVKQAVDLLGAHW